MITNISSPIHADLTLNSNKPNIFFNRLRGFVWEIILLFLVVISWIYFVYCGWTGKCGKYWILILTIKRCTDIMGANEPCDVNWSLVQCEKNFEAKNKKFREKICIQNTHVLTLFNKLLHTLIVLREKSIFYLKRPKRLMRYFHMWVCLMGFLVQY